MYRHTSFETYWKTGVATAGLIAEKIDTYLETEHPRIADWGCGLGRVIRHLPDRYQRHGFDYNHRAIGWVRANIDNVEFSENQLAPPLPVNAGVFDGVYALSVFTHLSKDKHFHWMSEIDRILAPGGILIAAFHMRPGEGQLLAHEQEAFDRGELVVRSGVKEGSRIFTAHHPEEFLRDQLFKSFEILEGPFEMFGQEGFVVRKRVSVR